MIPAHTIFIWLAILNLLAAALFAWIARSIPPSKSKRSFLFFLFSYCLWINPLLAIQLIGANHWASDFVARSILAGGCIFVAALGDFTLRFAAAQETQTLRYKFFIANFAFLFFAAYAGLIERGVRYSEFGLAPIPGPLQAYFNVSMVAYGLYFLGIAAISYRRSEDAFLKLQLKTILFTCSPAFFLGLTTNAIIPGVTGNFQLTPTGGLWLLLFFAGITYILVSGRMLLLRQGLNAAMQSETFARSENLLRLEKLMSYIQYRLDEPTTRFQGKFGFRTKRGKDLMVVLEQGETSSSPSSNNSTPNDEGTSIQSATIDGERALQELVAQNAKLSALAGAAQGHLVREHLLEKEHLLEHKTPQLETLDTVDQPASMPLPSSMADTLVPWKNLQRRLAGNIATQEQKSGFTEFCVSERKQQFLNSLSAARVTSNILLLEGACGVGKSHYAQLAHLSREGSSLTHFRCIKAQQTSWCQEVKNFLENPNSELSIGLLLKHVDKIPVEHLDLLTRVFRLNFSYERFAYLTVSPGFFETATDAPFNIIHLYANARVLVPRLSDCPEDLPFLMGILAERCSKVIGIPFVGLRANALRRAQSHTWPGNVYELEQALLSALLESRNGVVESLPLTVIPPVTLRDDEIRHALRTATQALATEEKSE